MSEEFYNENCFINTIDKFTKTIRSKKVLKDAFIPNFIGTVTYPDNALISYVFDRINNY
jgi:hypothetical protein